VRDREAQQIAARLDERCGVRARDRRGAQRRDAGTHHLAEERVREPHDRRRRLRFEAHDAGAIERIEMRRESELIGDGGRQRVGERDHLERGVRLGIEAAEPLGDQLAQLLRDAQRTLPDPALAAPRERARCDTDAHQFAQIEQVAVARIPDALSRGAVGGWPRTREQIADVARRLSRAGEPIAPEPSHGVGTRLTTQVSRAPPRARPCKLQHEPGRDRRRCVSSTQTSGGAPAGASDSATSRSESRAERRARRHGGRCAPNAPSGTSRRLIDAATRITRPSHSTAASSVASRVFPTPAPPAITTDPLPERSVSRTSASSSSRPISGHGDSEDGPIGP
jgi:hypothetical protein